jgi:Zn-dependent membrane protease YugP
MFFDPMYFILLAPGLLLMLWAQSRVKSAYRKWGQVRNMRGLTGAQAARMVLDANGLQDVPIEAVPGDLTDHYDPRTRVLRLSQGVYGVPSVAAVAVAAHEAGHAIQHATGYAPLQFRTSIVPVVSIGSNFGFLVLIAGIMFQSVGIAWVGVGLFALSTLFALVTLPVEFDASSRAKAALVRAGLVDSGVSGGEESKGVNAVLSAAAWTYIAGFATSVLTLLYYVMAVMGMRRSD